MKAFSVSVVFVLFSFAASAQAEELPVREFKPMKESKLELKFLDKKATSGRGQFQKPAENLTLRQKPARKASVAGAKLQQAASQDRMPIHKPDSTILFPMLAAAPDSTIHYYLKVKKQ